MIIRHATFHAAIGYLLATQPTHARVGPYEVTDVDSLTPSAKAHALEEFETQASSVAMTPEIAGAHAELLMGRGHAAVYAIGSEAHYGYVLAHYTRDGEPVSFHSFA